MLNYKVTYLTAALYLVILITLRFVFGYPLPLWLFWLVLLALPLYVWGAMNIRSGFYIPVRCEAATTEKVVALSFDDGPLPEHTPLVLDILRQQQAPAAFFCIGKHIAGNENLLQRIHEEGHVIGNHSFSHDFWFDMYNKHRMLADLASMDQVMENATGLQPRLFRPPYGVTNPNLAKAIREGGYTPIGWNIRSLDTVAKDEQQLLAKIISQLQPGAVILLHDTCSITARILPALISAIREKGYRLERIDKMLNVTAYA